MVDDATIVGIINSANVAKSQNCVSHGTLIFLVSRVQCKNSQFCSDGLVITQVPIFLGSNVSYEVVAETSGIMLLKLPKPVAAGSYKVILDSPYLFR